MREYTNHGPATVYLEGGGKTLKLEPGETYTESSGPIMVGKTLERTADLRVFEIGDLKQTGDRNSTRVVE